MTTSKVPIDTLIQTVFSSIDSQLKNVKNSVFTSQEMEELLIEVESGQRKIEEQLAELRGKNKNLLNTLGLQMPIDTGLSALGGGFANFD